MPHFRLKTKSQDEFNGDILSSKEVFKNIKLPVNLRIAISKKYPKWLFKSNTYSIKYTKNKAIKKHIKLKLQMETKIKLYAFENF
ncbi:hypothetical protein A8C32_01520 [Flavivirga aquatica]|uniref:Uncharacterized protein n=1 Tax=Flavivirga aquatica TaxID=1849968 RepID=A0A1E5T9Z8_9FLAO|nr:hypothetical protein [Flavivirga aquatica]OEK08168.1 hypothetical protein A8C32_01520 [Flavivirga aquatica]